MSRRINYKKLENKQEKALRKYAKDFCREIGWGKMPVDRFRFSNLTLWRGLYLPAIGENGEKYYFIWVSSNSAVYHADKDLNKQVFAALVHELVHYKLELDGYPDRIAHKHGKTFLKYCQDIELLTNGYFTAKELTK